MCISTRISHLSFTHGCIKINVWQLYAFKVLINLIKSPSSQSIIGSALQLLNPMVWDMIFLVGNNSTTYQGVCSMDHKMIHLSHQDIYNDTRSQSFKGIYNIGLTLFTERISDTGKSNLVCIEIYIYFLISDICLIRTCFVV